MKPGFGITCAIIFLIFAGCSGNGGTPISPSTTNHTPIIQNGHLNVGVSDYFADGTPAGGTGIMGLYQVWVDNHTLKGEIVPARETQLTDTIESIDITNFLTIAPCTDCAKLMSVEMSIDGNLVLKIGIKHPYPPGDPLKPITGLNRADLHVFNVEGTIVTDGFGTPTEFPNLKHTLGNIHLLNADGYSSYLDESLEEILSTVSTLHPYILHFDDYSEGNYDPETPMGFESVTDPGPSGNLVMPMGSDYDVQEYIFAASIEGQFEFLFAIGCTYGVSAANKASRFNPEYRVPQHCKKAASEVKVEIVNNELYGLDDTSTADLLIKILDINHQVPVGTALNEMLADSSIKAISIEAPGLTAAPQVINSPTPISGNGRDPLDPLTFEFLLVNTAGGDEGTYQALVRVLDNYAPGQNTSPLLQGMDGIKRVDPIENPLTGLFDIQLFATYQTFTIDVAPAFPDCSISTIPDPPNVPQGDWITFDGSGSSHHLPIISYEWDLDYDGSIFSDPPDEIGPVITVQICKPGTRYVALKVTDERDMSTICEVETTINADTGSIGPFHTDLYVCGTAQGVETNVMGFRSVEVYKDDLYIVFWDWGRLPGRYQAWFVRSDDRGATWNPEVNITQYSSSNYMWVDPAIVVDRNNGDIYVIHSSDGASREASQPISKDILINKSSDRGDTWGPEIRVNESWGSSTEEWASFAIDDSVDPAYLYVSYASTITSNRDIHVATARTDDINTWTHSVTDDTGNCAGSLQSTIYVHPIDKSVLVAWGDAMGFGGAGQVMFDRSTDHATTWGTDVLVYAPPGTVYGPYNATVVVNPTTGIPGMMWRECLSGNWQHQFAKATSQDGSSWETPILIDSGSGYNLWAGSLDVSYDGHWVACTMLSYRVSFRESLDDGLTWSTAINIDDGGRSAYNPNMKFDECKNLYVAWSVSGTPGLWFDWGT